MRTGKATANFPEKQRGAVLIISLVFLLLTALISSVVIRTSIMENKMVGNSQFSEEAFQINEGVINALAANYSSAGFTVRGTVGHTQCSAGNADSSCDIYNLSLPSAVTAVPSGVSLSYQATRKGPETGPLPIRLDEKHASGDAVYAFYDVETEFDGRDSRLGYHSVHQGIAFKIVGLNQ